MLIVDDEPIDIKTMRRVLETDAHLSVLTACDYNDAMRVAETHPEIDLALIDVALPGKNGVELARHLLAAKPGLRIVFVSGHVGAEVIRFYGMNAGDEHFLQKPFDSKTLLEKTRQALESQKPLEFILSAATSGASEEEPPEGAGS